ncbi:MAG: RluA family pseudouridine synthase [Acidimicrobiia bacterium]|nr:RluA family pseudouridine synthase [Acidimicrobiia bacterium]NNF11207.1 RluA family pseudouridine synthase [Acidimicrobiia bacterium]NNL68943.1 RluA family pseudouridine synthase [Acidimicrobiia bacterium]
MSERSVVVPNDLAGERIDLILARLAEVSRGSARKLIESGSVEVDGQAVVSPSVRLESGASVRFAPPERPPPLAPERVDFSVVWEDADLAVVDKPAGIVTHPGAGNASGTLAGGLLDRWPEIAGIGDTDRWGIVHRLDKGTSGLLVVAKSGPALAGLRDLVRQRRLARTYLALVELPMSIETGTVDAPIDRDPNRPMRRRVHPAGRPARTHYEQLAAWPDHGMLEVRLETGRTHQIRVHLAAIGHPVVGDRTYGARTGDPADPGRPWLHSWRLAFDHPITAATITAESPLPDDLVASLQALSDPSTGTLPDVLATDH